MELIPKAFVIGLFAATPAGLPDRGRLDRLWSEVASRQDYRQFTITGEGAQFLGGQPDDGLVIQPPLIQVRSSARLGAPNAADDAQYVMKAVSRHMGWAQFFNLGIKHIYNAPAPANDGTTFVLRKLMHCDEMEHNVLERGDRFWGGLKYGAGAVDGSSFTVQVEPLLSDNQFLFIDVDAQFPGAVDLDRITDRAAEAHEYASRAVRQYLEAAEQS